MKFKLVFVSLLLSLSLVGCGIESTNNNEASKDSNTVDSDSKETTKPVSITLSIAGDVTLGNYHGASYYATFDHEVEMQNNYDFVFENVNDVFSKDDLTIVNLEGPLTTASQNADKTFAFRGDPSYVNFLKSGSIEAVSLANNHSIDYFEQGFNDTKKILSDNDINYFGLDSGTIVEVDGINVGLLGYKGWGEYYTDDNLEIMKKDIDYMNENADMTLVYFHWGIEGQYYPEQYQKDFAHFCIDNGVDAVIGAHPHVVQGIEKYNDKYIAYSMGNFAFGGNKNPSDKDSFIYQQTFTFEDSKLSKVSTPNVIPCSISSTSSRNDYKPTVLSDDNKDRVLNKINEISIPLN